MLTATSWILFFPFWGKEERIYIIHQILKRLHFALLGQWISLGYIMSSGQLYGILYRNYMGISTLFTCLLTWYSRCHAYSPKLPHTVLCNEFTDWYFFKAGTTPTLKLHRKMKMPVQIPIFNLAIHWSKFEVENKKQNRILPHNDNSHNDCCLITAFADQAQRLI